MVGAVGVDKRGIREDCEFERRDKAREGKGLEEVGREENGRVVGEGEVCVGVF